jgi:NitT/TauT family transport system ATP-binding protein
MIGSPRDERRPDLGTVCLELKNLGFSYETRKGKYQVFRNLDLTVRSNEFFCIIGPSGCGKTTLLNILAGFEEPTEGQVSEDGELINGVSPKRALVFQQDAVFPWLTVRKNIEYGLRFKDMSEEERRRKVRDLIEIVGLVSFEDAYPRELSGGMRKRVDLARSLACDPKILLMDEPFGSLDAITKEKLQLEVTAIWELRRMTIVFITHDLEEALFLGDRVAVMQHIKTNIPFRIFDVPFERPRTMYLRENQQFQGMRRRLVEEFKLLEDHKA